MEVRLLKPDDAKAYWELRLEALKSNPEAFASSYEEAIQRKEPIKEVASRLQEEGSYTFGMFNEGNLIGNVTLVQEKVLKMQHRGNIYAMYVSAENRKAGVGRSLMNAVIGHAKTIPVLEKLNLTVEAKNEKAKNLYTSLGFKSYGYEEKALKVDGQFHDEEHMVLFL
ncbi:GNAT family N-acetyltransferase [Fictibacillus sp. 26RED30]|uniref:GNAT family N-acetyltransferase n=1 Tax=Fictibacillus sp. 26RED30 TaxID=2745877 RepID=UPI0018CE5951|nr:GNAT family N-acetyltransferase [Fictibacillus sp. 26RED30]MBH0162737.1 GNAT family N-acetyltransferase [Fictibacillus sp. 26RED30]